MSDHPAISKVELHPGCPMAGEAVGELVDYRVRYFRSHDAFGPDPRVIAQFIDSEGRRTVPISFSNIPPHALVSYELPDEIATHPNIYPFFFLENKAAQIAACEKACRVLVRKTCPVLSALRASVIERRLVDND